MAGMGAGYDLSVSTFSPDGRVFQVEYAGKAVDNSGTCIGIVCKDGIILGVEKYVINKMLIDGTNKRIYSIDKHIGIAIAGMLPDARQIIQRAYDESISYRKNYGEDIPVQILAERIGLFVHAYTLYWSVRPFGAAILVGGIDPPHEIDEMYDNICEEEKEEEKNNNNNNIQFKGEIYCIEPSGTSYRYFGMAIGKGKQTAKTELEKLKLNDITCKDALFHICKILNLVHDESKDKNMEIEMSWICANSNYVYQKVPQHLILQANQQALKHIQELENA